MGSSVCLFPGPFPVYDLGPEDPAVSALARCTLLPCSLQPAQGSPSLYVSQPCCSHELAAAWSPSPSWNPPFKLPVHVHCSTLPPLQL